MCEEIAALSGTNAHAWEIASQRSREYMDKRLNCGADDELLTYKPCRIYMSERHLLAPPNAS